MKSLGYYEDPSECAQVRDLLASRGIPTFWAKSYKSIRGMLFVCINEQLEDALAVLKDPNHEVANPVDVAEFERRAETDGLGTILRGSAAILGVLICIVGVLLVLHLVG